VLSVSEPWSIIEFTVLLIAAVILALKEYGEKLPEIITKKVSPVFKNRHWAAVPLILVCVYVSLLIIQLFGVLPKDRGEPSHADLRAPVSVPAPQSDEDVKRIAALQSHLSQAQQEIDHGAQNLGTLQSELSSKNVELENTRQHVTAFQSQLSETQRELTNIQNRDQTRIGPQTAINFVDVLTLSDALKTIPKTLVLLTSTPDNEQLRFQLEIIFNTARAHLGDNIPWIIMGRPNYDKQLDAPPLQETPGNGITIHGRNPAGDYLMQRVFAMNNCLSRRQTAKTPDEFLTYYHLLGGANDVKDTAWIERGNNRLWGDPEG
jgi:hypothetical protein